jgi:8-oxo-dGTP pyrophosphatase MutT (NUDIX family)
MEYSFGIIPLRRIGRQWEVFLIQHRGAGHWAFPKGHAEEGETSQETAQREMQEETGLRLVNWLPYPPLEETYRFNRHGKLVDKRVTYFIAEVTGEVCLQSQEIAAGRWLNLKEALDLITFTEGKRICQRLMELFTREQTR